MPSSGILPLARNCCSTGCRSMKLLCNDGDCVLQSAEDSEDGRGAGLLAPLSEQMQSALTSFDGMFNPALDFSKQASTTHTLEGLLGGVELPECCVKETERYGTAYSAISPLHPILIQDLGRGLLSSSAKRPTCICQTEFCRAIFR